MVIKPPTATYLLKNAAGIQRGARLLGIYITIPPFNLDLNMKYIEKLESFQILLTND